MRLGFYVSSGIALGSEKISGKINCQLSGTGPGVPIRNSPGAPHGPGEFIDSLLI